MESLGKRFVRAAGVQFTGNIIRVILGMLASMQIVRWLGPDEFGQASWAISITLYLSVLCSGGLGTPFVRAITEVRLRKSTQEMNQLLKSMLMMRTTVVGVVVLAYFGWLVLGESRLPVPEGASLLVYVPALLMVTYLHSMVVRILQVFFRQKAVVIITTAELVFKVVLFRVIGGSNPGGDDLIVATLISEFVAFLAAAGIVSRIKSDLKQSTADIKPGKTPGWKQLLSQGRPSWLLSIATRVLGREVDIILLGILSSPLEITKYALPFSLAVLSVSLAGGVLQSTTTMTTFAEAGKSSDPSRRAHFYKALLEYWFLFVVPISFGGGLLGNRLLELLYGDSAAGCGKVTALLFAAVALSNLSEITKDAMQGMGEDKRPAVIHMAAGVLNLVLSVLWIPVYGATGAALATLLSAALIVVTQLIFLPDELKIHPARRLILVVGTALLGMCVAVLVSDHVISNLLNDWFSALVLIAIGVVVYFLSLGVIQPHSSLRNRLNHLPSNIKFARRVL